MYVMQISICCWCMHAHHVPSTWKVVDRMKWAKCGRYAKGSHLYVPCKSVCDQDQNWIKWSKPFLRANQRVKVAFEPQKSQDQNTWLEFDLWPIKNQAIKSFRKEWWSDQAQFFSEQQFWSRSQTLQHVTYKWLGQPSEVLLMLVPSNTCPASLATEGVQGHQQCLHRVGIRGSYTFAKLSGMCHSWCHALQF